VALAQFLKPTKLKFIFLLEWTVFILIQLIRGELRGLHPFLVACSPLILFYLLASGFAHLSNTHFCIAEGWKIIALGILLTTLDQFLKIMASILIPYQSSLPIVQDWLHLSHIHNLQGSWIVSSFNLVYVSKTFLFLLVISLILSSIFIHRYYLRTHRESFWVDLAFLGLFAGLLSWIIDMGWRGYILDFIQLPGVVAADLKDILMAIGLASFLVEAIDNPEITFHWKGFRNEVHGLCHLSSSFIHFASSEIRKKIEDLKKLNKMDLRK